MLLKFPYEFLHHELSYNKLGFVFESEKYFLASISISQTEKSNTENRFAVGQNPRIGIVLLKILNKFPANSTLASKKNGF